MNRKPPRMAVKFDGRIEGDYFCGYNTYPDGSGYSVSFKWEYLMRLDEQYRTCVAYVCIDSDGEMVPIGTAFQVAWPINSNLGCLYLITACHVVKEAYKSGLEVYVRANKAGGELREAAQVPVSENDWVFDIDRDVAVLPWSGMPGERLALRSIPINFFYKNILEQDREHGLVGLGHEVGIVSLFSSMPGADSVEPIVRQGHIALVPPEPVPVYYCGQDRELDAVLIEARSFGGISGAPVFVDTTFYRLKHMVGVDPTPEKALLGFVHGHFDHEQKVYKKDKDNKLQPFPGLIAGDNSGIAMVVTADSILEVLACGTLKKQREDAADKQKKSRPRATADSALPDDEDDPIGPAKRVLDQTIRRSEEPES